MHLASFSATMAHFAASLCVHASTLVSTTCTTMSSAFTFAASTSKLLECAEASVDGKHLPSDVPVL